VKVLNILHSTLCDTHAAAKKQKAAPAKSQGSPCGIADAGVRRLLSLFIRRHSAAAFITSEEGE
jgi:hypothetical protein